MFSISKIIVLVVIIETTVGLVENEHLNTRLRSRPQNVNDPTQQTNKTEEQLIRILFKVKESGEEYFNVVRTNTTNMSVNQKQDFKVQRNSDGKLDIVFNDVSFSQKSVPQRRTTNTNKPEKDIYFPDEINIDPECKREGNSLCTKVENYPEKELENILKNQNLRLDVLFNDYDNEQPVNITQRMSPGEESLCSSVERVEYPRAGESKDSRWLYIVNHPNATQGVKVEKCLNEGSNCMFAEYFPNGYTAKCKQNYTYRPLIALTTTGELVKDLFKIPSCCKCIYKQE